MTLTNIKYPTYENVIWLYDRVIELSEGGVRGFRDEGELLYLLEIIQNDDLVPDFTSKITLLVHRVCDGHIFLDGNKRMGLALGGLFLSLNNLYKLEMKYLQRMEAISYHIAARNISEDLLNKILTHILQIKDYDEDLKIELYEALNTNPIDYINTNT